MKIYGVAKIHAMLSDPKSGIPSTSLTLVGFGPDFDTAAADGPETERQKDRRLLLVRN
jgi:hypothetical protein